MAGTGTKGSGKTVSESVLREPVAPFVIEGVYDRWRTMIEQGQDPIKNLMQGKFKLTRGHLPTIIRYVESSKELLKCAQAVSTEFRK